MSHNDSTSLIANSIIYTDEDTICTMVKMTDTSQLIFSYLLSKYVIFISRVISCYSTLSSHMFFNSVFRVNPNDVI